MGCLHIGQGVRGTGSPNIRSTSLFAKKWLLMEREQGSQRQRWPHGCKITSTSAARHTLQVHFILYSSSSLLGLGFMDLERLLRIGVDMIASSEEPLPQSGLGVSNRPPAGTGPRTSPREPAPPASVPRISPADLPPRRSWRPRGPPCEEVAALRVGRDDGGAGGRGAGCAADGRGGREGGAAALGGGGLKTWEARCAVLCQFRRARWKPGSTSFCLPTGSPRKACVTLSMRTDFLPFSLANPPSILTRAWRSSVSFFLVKYSLTMSKLLVSDMVAPLIFCDIVI